MLFHFHTSDVTFFDEDKDYFEERLSSLIKYLGSEAGDEDSTQITVNVTKNKHHSGDRFEAKAHMTSPHGGNFHAEVHGETIRELADFLKDNLGHQVRKFHEKHK